MALNHDQWLFAKDISLLIQHIADEGYSCTFGEAFRTPEQAKIDAQNGTGIVDSLHCLRLAIDLNLFLPNGVLAKAKDYERFGCMWENLDARNRWGGRFTGKKGPCNDANHFERRRPEGCSLPHPMSLPQDMSKL